MRVCGIENPCRRRAHEQVELSYPDQSYDQATLRHAQLDLKQMAEGMRVLFRGSAGGIMCEGFERLHLF